MTNPGNGILTAADQREHSLLQFLRHPALNAQPPNRLSIWRWVGWLSFLFLVALLGGVLNGILEHVLGIKASTTFLTYLLNHASWRAAVIVGTAPLTEELAFRAMLSTSARSVFIGLAFFITYLFVLFRLFQPHTQPGGLIATPGGVVANYFDPFWILLPASLASLLLYFFARSKVMAVFQKHGIAVFWISCILFGVGHAMIYVNHFVLWSILLVLPQFILGVLLASIRVRFGLRWSIASHYAIDSLIIYGAWLYLAAAPDPGAQRSLLFAIVILGIFAMLYAFVMCVRIARGRC